MKGVFWTIFKKTKKKELRLHGNGVQKLCILQILYNKRSLCSDPLLFSQSVLKDSHSTLD